MFVYRQRFKRGPALRAMHTIVYHLRNNLLSSQPYRPAGGSLLLSSKYNSPHTQLHWPPTAPEHMLLVSHEVIPLVRAIAIAATGAMQAWARVRHIELVCQVFHSDLFHTDAISHFATLFPLTSCNTP